MLGLVLRQTVILDPLGAEVVVPTLVIHGSDDKIVPFEGPSPSRRDSQQHERTPLRPFADRRIDLDHA